MKKIKRFLSAAEKTSLLAEQNFSHNCLSVTHFNGVVNKKNLVTCLKKFLKIYPCLTAKLDFENEIKIEYPNKIKTYINFNILENKNKINKKIVELLKIKFNLKKGPLFSINFISFQNTNEKVIIFLVHHIISDGISVSYLPLNFIKLLENISLSKLPIKCKPYEFLPFEKFLNKEIEDFKFNRTLIKKSKLNDLISTNFLVSKFSVKKTLEIIQFCNKNKVTVQSLLVSACIKSMKEICVSKEVNCIIPVDLRKYTNEKITKNHIGFYSSWVEFKIKNRAIKDKALIKLTKRKILKPLLDNQPVKNYINLISDMKKNKNYGIIDQIQNTESNTVCVSNTGRINIDYKFERFKIKSIYLGLNSFFRVKEAILIIAATFEDKMSISFMSPYPIVKKKEAKCVFKSIIKNIKEFV